MKYIKHINEMFEIGEKISPPVYKNVYKLVIENMSGDADAYHDSITYFEKKYENLLSDIVELCKSCRRWNRSQIEKSYDNIKLKYPNYFHHDDDDIITMDVFSDGAVICRPSIKSLTWFDENGIEYNVKY